MIPSQRRVEVNLQLMRDVIRDAMSFIEGVTRAEFLADKRTQRAVAMSLVIMGEHASGVCRYDPNFEATHPSLALREVVGMRNRIAHDYHSLDFPVIWTIVADDLPPLLAQLDALLATPGR